MARHRQGRMSEEIKKSISSLLINGVKDPRLANRIITISEVNVSSDGSYATVFVTPLILDGEDKDQVCTEVLAGFDKAKGLLRKQVSNDIKLRHTPELSFKIDLSMDYGRHIDTILDEIMK
ncbi:MAG: 30S ribosome-binding factor RbfA [Clostridiales bacterium]|jgi:ribosome-binding factor A|nr:30S ribosome-binding factor RbfA [Clostridiales bacterium]